MALRILTRVEPFDNWNDSSYHRCGVILYFQFVQLKLSPRDIDRGPSLAPGRIELAGAKGDISVQQPASKAGNAAAIDSET